MFREDFLEAVTVSFNQKDGWSRVGQETKQRMAQGKAEEQARVCDTLGRLSGAGQAQHAGLGEAKWPGPDHQGPCRPH